MCLAMIRKSLCILVSTAILLAWSSATLHAQEPKRTDVNAMIHKLRDPSEGVRMQAAKTLGVLGAAAQSAIPALREAAKTDPDEDVRRIAAAALQRIQAAIPDTNGIQPLLKDLQNPDEGVRLKAAKTLGKMGVAARAAIPFLQKLAQHDPDADVRAVATRSLASITGPPTEPDPNAGGGKAFTPVGAGFTVRVPVDPVESRLPGEVRYEFRFPNQKADAKFGYVDLPVDEVRGKSPQEIMASLEKELSAERKTKKLLSSQIILLDGGFPGREMLYSDKVSDRDEFTRARIYAVGGTRLYMLGVIGSSREAVESNDVDRFFGSFRLTTVPKTNLPIVPPKTPPQPKVDPQPKVQPQQTSFVTIRDPREGAFTLQVPAKWKFQGGTKHPNTLVVTFEMTAVSPDGKVTISLTQNESGRMAPSPGLDWLGLKEGGIYNNPQGGGRFPIQRYRAGARFLIDLVFPTYQQDTQGLWQGLKVVQVTNRPDLADALTVAAGFEQMDAGEVRYEFQRRGQAYRGGALVITRFLDSGGGLDMWHLATLASYEGPADREAEAMAAMVHMVSTFRVNDKWADGVNAKLRSQVRSIADAGNVTSQIINSSYWRQQKVKDSILWRGSSVRRDSYQAQDPLTGEAYTVQGNWNYHWIDAQGNRVGTNAPQPPGAAFRRLILVDE